MNAAQGFEAHMEHLAEGLGHSDRHAGLKGCCTGLMLPLERKSEEPIAYPLGTVLRIHLMQNRFGLSDPAIEEALYEVASMRQFAGLSLTQAISDETTILNFRRQLEVNEMAAMIITRINTHLTRQGLLLRRGSMVHTFKKHRAILSAVADLAPSDEKVGALYRDLIDRLCAQSRRSLAAVRRKGLSRTGATDHMADMMCTTIVDHCIRAVGGLDPKGLDRLAHSLGYLGVNAVFADPAEDRPTRPPRAQPAHLDWPLQVPSAPPHRLGCRPGVEACWAQYVPE